MLRLRFSGVLPTVCLLLAACSAGEGGESDSVAAGLSATGPDPIVLRIPRDGGVVRAYRYPQLDSTIWRSSEPAPAVASVLAFDQEDGVVAVVGKSGAPGWIDLRLGIARMIPRTNLTALSSADGYAIYGIDSAKTLVRYTPTNDWRHPTSGGRTIRRLFPQPDGSLIYLLEVNGGVLLHRIRPPEREVIDSATLPVPQRSANTAIGDRVYFAINSDLRAVSSANLGQQELVRGSDEILAIAPTPSGDRVYLASKGRQALDVVDRYEGSIEASVRLPGFATDLRMDPLGRFLLARPIFGDSAWVIDVGTNKRVGTVATAWRTDLPLLAVDGSIATLQGNDVIFVDGSDGDRIHAIKGGASDYWYHLLWNGFRPRAKGLDQPIVFQSEDSLLPAEDPTTGTTSPRRDSASAIPIPPAATDTTPRERPREPAPSRAAGWTVQFASLLSEERARELADDIRVDGARARVMATRVDGTPIYRVILGPFPTRDEAERVGRASGHSFWVIEGIP